MRLLLRSLLISGTVVVLDQLTKWWASMNLSEPRVVVPSFFRLTLSHNPGALFGLAGRLPSPWRGILLTLIPALAVGVIVFLVWKTKPGEVFARLGLALILGGAVGNVIDRIRFGHVVDFLDLYAGWPAVSDTLISWFGTNRWPTFNVADMGLTFGGLLLCYELFFRRSSGKGSKGASLSD